MCLTMFPDLWFIQAKWWNLSKRCSQYNDGVLSRARLSVTPWTVACWSSLPMGFLRQELWSGLSRLPQGRSAPRDQTQVSRIAGGFFMSELPGQPHYNNGNCE